MSADFFEQYKRPEWQKRRLQRLEAADWTCEDCGGTDQQLHVHHKRYIRGRKVWEYADDELAVLCEGCHSRLHDEKQVLDRIIAASPELSRITALIAGFLHAEGLMEGDMPEVLKSSFHIDPLEFMAGRVAYLASGMNVSFLERLPELVEAEYKKWRSAGQQLDGFR